MVLRLTHLTWEIVQIILVFGVEAQSAITILQEAQRMG